MLLRVFVIRVVILQQHEDTIQPLFCKMVCSLYAMSEKERGLRLKLARETMSPPVRPTDLARLLTERLGRLYKQQHVYNWETRPSAPPVEAIPILAEVTGVRADWLMNGDGLMRAAGVSRGDIQVQRQGFKTVFVHGAIAAGVPTYDGGDIEPVEMADWGTPFVRWGRFIVGQSMTTNDPETSLEPGDIVFFEDRSAEPGHVVHAVKDGEHAVKVLRATSDGYALCSMAEGYPAFSAKDFEIRGIVVERWRRGYRTVSKMEYHGGLTLRPPSANKP